TGSCRIASQASGATTDTSAPAAASAAALAAATGPPPTTRTRRPCSFRKIGNKASFMTGSRPSAFGSQHLPTPPALPALPALFDQRRGRDMQPALCFRSSAPAAGAAGFPHTHRRRAWLAADARITLVVQRVVWHLVRFDVVPHLRLGPHRKR